MPPHTAKSADQTLVFGHSASVIPRRRRGGFALLITITLLAFLVLLLVSLASLTRVETQVASNSQQLAQARQNALMALNIAIGQLQKYAGPDQRTTARADLENGAGKNNSQWIGVYGSSVSADYTTATPVTIATDLTTAANLTTTGSPARLLNWLVSGNETAAFNPAWSTGDVGSSGQITALASALASPFKPAGTVTNLTATTAATDTTLTITNAAGTTKRARLLVGGNSVTSSLDASNNPIDYVIAPTVDITASSGSVPGISGSPTIGRYAWWVGDEGMKARVNLPLAGTDPALSAADKLTQQRNAFSNSTRDAIELMASNTPNWATTMPEFNASRIDTLYTPDQTVTGIMSPSQAPLASSSPSSMSAALKYRFHDITTQSLSVLSDTYAGGLKRDLSKLLDSSFSPKSSDATANAKKMWVPHGDDGSDAACFLPGFGIPTWQHLRSYAQTRIPTTGADKFKLTARLPVNDKDGYTDDVGIGPVITYFSVGYRAALAGPPAPGVQIDMNLYPLVVIWNPYNFTLKAPPAQPDGSTYEAGVFPTYNLRIQLEANVAGTWTSKASFDFQQSTVASPAGVKFIRFRLKCPDIPPGQSLIFSLPTTSSGQLYNQKNILENIEPEAGSYVSIPILSSGSPVTVQASDIKSDGTTIDYRLNEVAGSGSSSFKGGGGIGTYLGQPDDISVIAAGGGTQVATRACYNPSSTTRHWYNTHQEMDWSGLVVTPPFQEPGPLVYDLNTSEPAYVFQCQALFSGLGHNAQLNANQYMFSTRWLAQGNMRGTRSGRTRRDSNYNVLFTATAGQPFSATGFPWQKFDNGPGSASNRTSAGQGHDWINGAPVDVTLFEFPYDNQPLQSIGQLQHANLALVGAYPSYPIGNSLADFRLHGLPGSAFPNPQPPGWQLARVDRGSGNQGISFVGADMNGYYDISYLLNRTLWDRYYFSTVPATGTVPTTLPNPRHLRYNASVNLQDANLSATGLVLAGGFNINSTSEQAWRAVLGGGNQLTFDPQNPDTSSANILQASFPRFTRPNAGDDPNDVWKGYRTLNANQIAQLARNIVTEIRNRGPFVSLADFVNRRLVDNTATSAEDETFRGPIQAAIDSTATSAVSGQYPANDAAGTFWSHDLLITSSGSFINQSNQYGGTPISNFIGMYSRPQLEGRLNSTTAAVAPYGDRCAFAPKYITQADILAKIGAGLSARSDTFTIRTYGESVNPALSATDAGYITGRAWCEAVVQRLPEYVDQTDSNLTAVTDTTVFPAGVTPVALGNATAPAKTNATNQAFGRKFKIVSFRWLSPNDI